MNTPLKDPAESIVAMIGQLAVLPREEALARVREVVAKHEQAPQAEPSDGASLAHELDGVIADVEQGKGFDAVCLETIKRVRSLLARYGRAAAPHSDLERARQGLPPYNPSMPTEQDWQRITENGRKAWGGAQSAASAEPVCVVKENPYCPEGLSDEISEYLPTGMKLYAAPVTASVKPLARQTISDRFSFLEGVVNEHNYRRIVDTACEIARAAPVAAQAQPKRRPYNTNGSLSEYGIFPECDAAPAAQAPRACPCHPDDRPDGSCRERYAASECQALAAQAPAANADALDALIGMKRFFGKWPEFVPGDEYIDAASKAVSKMNAVIDAAMQRTSGGK